MINGKRITFKRGAFHGDHSIALHKRKEHEMFSQKRIKAVADVKRTIRQPYAWPGGYPLFAITDDGGALCVKCLEAEFTNVCHSTLHEIEDGWSVAVIDVNWEFDICCDHCGAEIESVCDIDEGKVGYL